MNLFTRCICTAVGHTWDCVRVRTDDGLKVIGYQCYHCGTFKPYRPVGILDRYFE